MRRLNILLTIMFLMAILPSVSALTYQEGTQVNLKVSCGNIDCTNPFISIQYPNTTLLVDNQSMTSNGVYSNYSFTPDVSGEYQFFIANYSDSFTITGTGEIFDQAKAIGMFIIFLGLFLVFSITIYGAMAIPFKNNRNEEGNIVSINDLKYLKIVLWTFAYLESIFIIMILKNMTYGLATFNGAFQIFNILFMFLLIALLPFFGVLIWYTIMIWLEDKKTEQSLQRGIPVE